jgi:arsenate reductase (thioredoxin)
MAPEHAPRRNGSTSGRGLHQVFACGKNPAPEHHAKDPCAMTHDLPRVLFLCTGNSCRSQMAEGWARHLHGGRLIACSAGVKTHGLNPDAVRVMAEAGVDISGHRSQHIDEFREVPIDLVVTVCAAAHETCPVFPARARVVHRGFDDPPRLAQGAADEASRLAPYRRVRDEIRVFVMQELPQLLTASR